MIHDNGIEKQIRPKTRNPGANTIAYYPLNSTTTVNDMSGNNRNLTNNGGTFGVYHGVDSCYINGNMYYNGISDLQSFTLNCWYCLRTRNNHYYLFFGMKNGTSIDVSNMFEMGEFDGWPDGYGLGVQYVIGNTTYGCSIGTSSADYSTLGVWYNGVVTYDGTTIKIYQNGTFKNSKTTSIDIGKNTIWFGYNSENSQLNISNAILENTARTAQEISDYFNQTKANYGL